MKQTFALVSHFFALLPLAVLFSSVHRGDWSTFETKISSFLFVFLWFVVGCSVAYHAVDEAFESYHALHAIDRFTSSTIIILTFWLYVDHLKRLTVLAVSATELVVI